MRLLNTKTFEIKEFTEEIPPYMILSHRWRDDEVTFEDFTRIEVGRYGVASAAKEKAGWSKVKKACEYAQLYKFDWIWIDTCCIDKSSSAELSEALNSMYQYYGDGRICIAYLDDVSSSTLTEGLKKSEWFKRGWTLQELIAPRYVVFLDEQWKEVGTRWSLRHTISQITSIPVRALETRSLENYSIAQKMSWAASRKTTREEDMAYCLMGIFGVNMSPIYGEGGEKAFMRLQQEIIRYSDDRSIFAWVAAPNNDQDRGLFARSPTEFKLSGKIGISSPDDLGDLSSFSFGNNGLRIYLPLRHQPGLGEDVFFALLHCPAGGDSYVGIYLQKRGAHYIRWCPHFYLPAIDMSSSKSSPKPREVVVKEGLIRRQQTINDSPGIPIEFEFEPTHLSSLSSGVSPFEANLSSTLSQSFKKGQESVDIFLVASHSDNIPAVRASFNRSSLDLPRWSADSSSGFLYQDHDLLPIEDNKAFVSCSVHMTGNESNKTLMKVDYISQDRNSTTFKFYQQIIEFERQASGDEDSWGSSGSQILVFAVENFGEVSSKPQEIYPADIPWTHNKNDITYVSLSDRGEESDRHCVFKYEMSGKFLFIVLGLSEKQESIDIKTKGFVPWIDVVVSDSDGEISDVQKSYLEGGSRYGRKGVRVSDENNGCRATATVKQKTALQSDLYHVSVDVDV